jgi:hypothetical protein
MRGAWAERLWAASGALTIVLFASGAASTAAAAGGTTAAAFLLLSAALYWTLAQPGVARDWGAARALFVLSLPGRRVAITLPLAVLIGAMAISALRRELLPRWRAWLGIAAAGVSLASVSVLLGPSNNRSAV